MQEPSTVYVSALTATSSPWRCAVAAVMGPMHARVTRESNAAASEPRSSTSESTVELEVKSTTSSSP
jgi:hypothetical protein